jgi:hypothetical protein
LNEESICTIKRHLTQDITDLYQFIPSEYKITFDVLPCLAESFHPSFGAAPLCHESEGKWISVATFGRGWAGSEAVLEDQANTRIFGVSNYMLYYQSQSVD